MDVTTILGVSLGIACILLGQFLEGGSAGSIVQLTAAVIVLGGTAGAVVAQFPLRDLRRALREALEVFRVRTVSLEPLVVRLVEVARRARREGLLSLEHDLKKDEDPFYREAVMALVDGTDAPSLRMLLEGAVENELEKRDVGPRLFEAAGGYAPTIGILGAVLGLIHVMENLEDPSRLGAGIAVAFVATVYGVGTANLIFLPLGEKLRMKVQQDARVRQVIIEGVCAIQEGLNPSMIERRLRTYLDESRRA